MTKSFIPGVLTEYELQWRAVGKSLHGHGKSATMCAKYQKVDAGGKNGRRIHSPNGRVGLT